MIRRQLPAYSPLPLRAVTAGVARSFVGSDPRPELEALLCDRYRAAGVRLAGSGTQALQLALETARRLGRLGAGVALPAFGCFDLASAVVGADVPVSFYDLEPTTLQPDLSSVERALATGAGTLVVAPLFGFPIAWDAVLEVAARRGALVIEDAAQGFGLEPRLRGELTVLSFGRGKGWTAGRGGALLARGIHTEELPSPIPRGTSPIEIPIRLAGQWALARPTLFGLAAALPGLEVGETVYHPPVAPTSLPRGAAAAALVTLEPSLAEVERRRATAGILLARLRERTGSALRAIDELPGVPPAYLRLPLLSPSGVDSLPDASSARRAGAMSSYPRILPELSELAGRAVWAAQRFPGARELVGALVTVPTHSRRDKRDLALLLQILQSKSW